MNFKLLPLILVGTLCFKPLNITELNDGKGKGNGKEKVVNKTPRIVKKVKNNDVKASLETGLKSNDLASVMAKNKSADLNSLNAADKMMLSAYLDLDEKHYAKPNLESFKAAYKGYFKLKQEGKIKKDILTIIDFTLSSTEKRMWVIDMTTNEVIFQTVVSHGRNSGMEYANDFSNRPESYKSSLGFYSTAETYMGKHGLSLRLDGLESGINDNARRRDIVIHGADYANENLANSQGRLGRSLGCPALPVEVSSKIINFIKGESCLFIFHDKNQEYLKKSRLFNS